MFQLVKLVRRAALVYGVLPYSRAAQLAVRSPRGRRVGVAIDVPKLPPVELLRVEPDEIEDVAIESLEALLEKVREVNSVEELKRRKTAWRL